MADWRAFLAKLLGGLASLFLVAMMLLTVTDVLLRALANRPIHGALELVELLLACTIFTALPAVFLRDENVVVDVGDHVWPRWVPALKLAAAVASVVVLAAMCWSMYPRIKDILAFGDVTSDLSIPRIYYWVPVLAGVAGAALAAAAMIVRWRRSR
jgi:TRAP-type C4-dicarboxylate transport system permease small subunit